MSNETSFLILKGGCYYADVVKYKKKSPEGVDVQQRSQKGRSKGVVLPQQI